ncbi:MAG: hypothetical protein ACLFRG_23755, partial [Desulfococcaceae bacterium]
MTAGATYPAIRRLRFPAAGLLAALLLLSAAFAHGGDREESRAWAGLDLFPSVLAADAEIADKRGPDGALPLVVLHQTDRELAEEMARRLARTGTIRGIPIRVEIARDPASLHGTGPPPAGMFLAEPRIGDLEAVIQFGRENRRLVFSPFAGDVERGVPAGIAVSDRILPLVNAEALESFGLRLKPFFLRIAEVY